MSNPKTTPLSREVVNEAIKELETVRDEADVMGKGFGHWVRDRVSFAIVLLKEGDND